MLRVPKRFSDNEAGRADWIRKSADTTNQIITKLGDYLPLTGGTLTGDLSVPDEAYGVAWNGSLEVPTKNALYDKIETISGGGVSDGDKGDIVVSSSGTVWSFDTSVVTAFAKTFLDDADAASVRTTIGAQASGSYLTASNNLSDVSNAGTARTNLGLGTIATQSAASVSITGGSITGITDLAVADGGTGASSASAARTNLGLVIGTDVQAYNTNLAGLAGLTLSQGDILYRDGSGLQRLAAGTSGQFLKTNGTSANPSWADVAAGLTYTQPAGIPGANDTGAFATLSNAFVLSANADVYALYGMFNAANSGDTYNMFIAAVDNSGNISSTVASGSSSFTTSATGIHFRRFALSAPVTLTAGTNYIIALVLTNRTTTTACRAYLTSGSYHELPQDFAAMSTNLGGFTKRFWYTQTSSSPGSGSPVSSSTSTTQYQLGMTVKLAA